MEQIEQMEREQELSLLAAAKAGDAAALSRLCTQYEPLLRAAAGQLHLRTIREDALAEGYVSFVGAVQAYDAGTGVPFAAFAKARVYGDLRTLFRRQRRLWERETLPAEAREEPFWEGVHDPAAEQALTRLEEQAALVAAMRCLTDGERRILRLIFWEERTQAEAARLLQVSQQAIAKAKKRALAKLRAVFAAEGEGGGDFCPAPA